MLTGCNIESAHGCKSNLMIWVEYCPCKIDSSAIELAALRDLNYLTHVGAINVRL